MGPSSGWSKTKAQGAHDLEHGGELGIPAGRKRLVEALSAKTGLGGDLRHALGPRGIAQRGCDEGRVAVLENRFEVERDIFFRLEVIRRVPRSGFRLFTNSYNSLAKFRAVRISLRLSAFISPSLAGPPHLTLAARGEAAYRFEVTNDRRPHHQGYPKKYACFARRSFSNLRAYGVTRLSGCILKGSAKIRLPGMRAPSVFAK